MHVNVCFFISKIREIITSNELEYRIYSKERLCSKERPPRISAPLLKPNGKERKTLAGAGRKPFNELVENQVLEWIYGRREKHLRVSCALILKKAKAIYD